MKSKPRNDTHRKIAAALVGQVLTVRQICNAIHHENWAGVSSAIKAMHRHREVVKLMPAGEGQPSRWRLPG